MPLWVGGMNTGDADGNCCERNSEFWAAAKCWQFLDILLQQMAESYLLALASLSKLTQLCKTLGPVTRTAAILTSSVKVPTVN